MKNCYNGFVTLPSLKTTFFFCVIIAGIILMIWASQKIGSSPSKNIKFINNANSFDVKENEDAKPDEIISLLTNAGIESYDQEILIEDTISEPLVFEISKKDRSPLYGAALPKIDSKNKKITIKIYLPENKEEYFIHKLSESYLYSLIMSSRVAVNNRPTVDIQELNKSIKPLMDKYEESGNYPIIVK